jgi:hypothetical protein
MIVPNGFWERWDEQQRQRSGGTAEQFKRRVLLPQLPEGLLETLAERLLAPEACVN